MDSGQTVLVSCTLEPGAFSGERTFRLHLADGYTAYSGAAPARYCFDAEVKPLERDTPPKGTEIAGFVEAYWVSNGGDKARVELPNGDAVELPVSLIRYQGERENAVKYVHVRS